MALFSEKGLFYTIITIGIVLVVNTFGSKIKDAINPNNEDELIRKYLLNDSPLYGYNRPKLWVHSKYEYNARKWKSFGSRSSTDLNQPYIHLTIRSIVNHCGDDFNICLIDDDSFSQLIPGWKTNVSELPEPSKHYYRELGMIQLLYIYGGLIVPNTFVCLHNLIDLYSRGISNEKPFVCETYNRYASIINNKNEFVFTSNHKFMGAPKRSPVIHDMVEYIKKRNENAHYSAEPDFFGYISKWLNNEVTRKHINIVDGKFIGIKNQSGKALLIEDLLVEGDKPIIDSNSYGIEIPGEEILKRTAYNWFSVMPLQQLLLSKLILVHYLKLSLVEPNKEKDHFNEFSRTVVAI